MGFKDSKFEDSRTVCLISFIGLCGLVRWGSPIFGGWGANGAGFHGFMG
jgi:hypothetical protein